MEDSKQFLEENATTYDVESDEKASPENLIYVYSGQAMDMEEVFGFSCVENVEPVIVAGEQGSGKTTLEVMMYWLFLEGRNESLMFSGSVTMKGFWERSKGLMKKAAPVNPTVARTLRTEKKFLHLALCDKDKKRKSLIFADYAGELFDDQECLNELGEFFASVSNVVVTIDGKKLCNYREKTAVISHAKVMLIKMQQAGILSRQTHLYIVCTKYDEVKKSEKKDATMKFIRKSYQFLEDTFSHQVNKMDLWYLYACGIDQIEEKKKMEELLLNFMEKNDEHDQHPIIAEEQMMVKRQMDKFQVRG